MTMKWWHHFRPLVYGGSADEQWRMAIGLMAISGAAIIILFLWGIG